jgi:hypothetical protein
MRSEPIPVEHGTTGKGTQDELNNAKPFIRFRRKGGFRDTQPALRPALRRLPGQAFRRRGLKGG